MAIAALVLWVLTAAAGAALLIAGNMARRAAASHAPATSRPPATGNAPAGPLPPLRPGEPRPIPRVTVHAPAGEHPLLEFSHPVAGLLGLGLWFIYVGTRHAPLAWAAFSVLVLTIVAGLSWFGRMARAARRGGPASAPLRFPPRLALLHGLVAAGTLAVAVLTGLSAGH